MKSVVFCPLHDSPGRADGREFLSQAHAFLEAHDQPNGVRMFDNAMPLPKRFSQTVDWLEQTAPGIDTFVWVCHGWATGAQFGLTLQNAGKLASVMKQVGTSNPTVVLYACSTGADNNAATSDTEPGPGGEGGVADALRHALVKAGCEATIYAHATVGHCTTNPFMRRFDPDSVAGGSWIVEPHSELWHAWVSAMQGSLRFRVPFMTKAQIEAELRGGPGMAA